MVELSDDAELLSSAARGDDGAACRVFDRHAPALLRFLTMMLGDIQAAEDALQETFLALFRNAAKYDPARSGLGTWLRRLAFNLARNEIRRRGRKAALSLETLVSEGGEARTLGDVLAAKNPVSRDTGQRALEMLDRVSERDREILILRYIEGLGPEEIGTMVGLKSKAVSMRLWRALAELRSTRAGKAGDSRRKPPISGQQVSGE